MFSSPGSDLKASILERLPPATKFCEYHSLHQFRTMLTAEHEHHPEPSSSQFIVFTNLDNSTFTRDFQGPIRDTPAHSIDAYLPVPKTLIIKLKYGSTEVTHSAIDMTIMGKLHEMNHAEFGLIGFDQTTIQTSSRFKEADVAYIPRQSPPGRTKEWPSFALESGYTDSQDMLDGNARWWLDASNGDTKIVMTVAVDAKWRRVNIRIYEVSDNGNVDEQTVTVSKSSDEQNTQVDNGTPLVISFRKLFLREPEPGDDGEMDIQLTVSDLVWIAVDIWDLQF